MTAGLAVIGPRDNNNYNGKLTWYVILSCMMAAMGSLLFGYDIGISGGVTSMDSFLRRFFPKVYLKMTEDKKTSNYCKFNSELLTSFTSSLYIAGLVATLFTSHITKVFGRKTSILVGGATFLVGSAIGGAAINIYMLILARLLLGVGVGFCSQAVPLYLSEMAPAKYRGAFSNGFQMSLALGSFIATLVNYGTQKIKGGWGWRVSLAIPILPASVLTLGALVLPETPNSLIQTSSPDDSKTHLKAKHILQKIRGQEDVDMELRDLVNATNSASKTSTNPWKTILKREYTPQLVMSIAIPFLQQFTGINVIGFYAPVLFRTIGFGESASLFSSVMTGLVGMTFTLISMLVVDKFGRRALFISGGVVMFVSQVAVGAILGAHLGDHGSISKGYAYLVLVLIGVYVAAFSWSWGPLGWLVPSEIFALEVRSVGQSITVASNFLFTFVIAQTTLAMLCDFKAGIFYFFAGWLLLMTGFVYWFLPETRNIPMEKMDQIWRDHRFWSRVVA